MLKHGLDPAETKAQDRLDAGNLNMRREKLESFLKVAAPKLDHLFTLVGASACGVLLTDSDGVVLDQRILDGDKAVFKEWGLWSGADWSEAAEGTNGIGTCLAENRRVIIHRDEHFLARNTSMSCIDAPIFGAEGELLAALDVSSARSEQTESINSLIAAMVAQTAEKIEAENFRLAFPEARIIVADHAEADSSMLLAVDRDDIVIGATRSARKAFDLDATGALRPRPASDLFGREKGPTGFKKAERAAVIRALARSDGNVSAAARALGIGRATLYRRMKRLNIGD
ncbi:MAG: GAF domain-containing protein [Pseudomonadota bacterium]